MDDQKHNNASQIRSRLSHIKMEIEKKQRLLHKWEKNLAWKRRRITTCDKPEISTSQNIESPKQSKSETDNDTSLRQTTSDEPKSKFEILNIEIPPSLSLNKKLLRNSEDLLNSAGSASNDLLMINTEGMCPRKSTRIKRKYNSERKSKTSKTIALNPKDIGLFPPFPNLLRDVKEVFFLPQVDFQVKDLEMESSSGNLVTRIPSPSTSPLFDDGFDFGVDPDAIATTAPALTLKSPNSDPIEIVRFWVDEHKSTILSCQRSYLSFWTKSKEDDIWNSQGFPISKINKDELHKFDVFKLKDNIGIVLASKCNTTVRISLFSFPHHNNTEKITLVSGNTLQILSCLCGDYLVYAFVDETSTSIDLWRIDSNLFRIFRGSTVSLIKQPIHSLCSLTTTSKNHFVGIGSSAVHIWNAISGSLIISICLDDNFTSIKSCSFATLEKGFLFLGVLHLNEQTEVYIIAINPKTGKWKCLVTLEESQAESIIIPDDFPTTSLLAIFSKRSVCLRSLDGVTIAKASLSPLDVDAISAIHLSYQSCLNVYSIAIGNSAGIINMYKLCV